MFGSFYSLFTGKHAINLLSYNVNGFADPDKRTRFANHFLFSKTSDCVPHIIALQDTRSQPAETFRYASQLYSDVLFSHPEEAGHTRGVLLAVHNNIEHKIIACKSDPKGRYLVAHLEIEGEQLVIVNVYPLHWPHNRKSMRCWILLWSLLKNTIMRWCCGVVISML